MSGKNKDALTQSILKERVSKPVRDIVPYSVPSYGCAIRLDGNESPFDLPEDKRQELFDKMRSIRFNRYPDSSCMELRTRLSHVTGVSVEGILIGNGSDELIQMLVETFTGKSSVVAVPSPTFSMYKIIAKTLGKKVVEVELDEDFDVDVAEFLKVIKQYDPDLFFFASPNNPTANSFSKKRLEEIISSSTGIVVVDEAYFDYFGKDMLPLLGRYPNLVILRTLSKVGFAALRVGILLASPDIVSEINKVRLPYNMNSMSLMAASFALDNLELIKSNVMKVLEEKERLVTSLGKIKGVFVYPSDANFVLISVPDSKKVFDELVKREILVRSLEGNKRLENCLRVTVGNSYENERLIEALSEILS